MRLVIARGSQITGALLRDIVTEKGGVWNGRDDAVVNYGVSMGQGRVFNTITPRTKFQELVALRQSGVSCPTVNGIKGQGIWLSRRFDHTRGRDIKLRTPQDFWVQYIPSDREFRVWMLRGKVLGVYEKIQVRPPERRHYRDLLRRGVTIRSHHAGYAFNLVEAVPEGLAEISKQALEALGLNFAALDVLHGLDGRWYVLEANTAPGVEGPGRVCLRKLASRIVTWQKRGYRWREDANV